MNLIDRLKNIANDIARFFASVPKQIKKYAAVAHGITTKLKNDLDGDIADLVVSIIPGDWDSELRDSAVNLLTELAKILKSIEGDDEAAKAAKNAILAKSASKLIALQDGNELKERVYDMYQAISYSGDTKKLA